MTPRDISERLRGLPSATIYEAAGKRGDMAPEIRPMVPGARFAGPAYTVRTFPSDSTAVIRALDDARPGSVLVIDAGGAAGAAVWGGTSSLFARERGIAACVTNGCVRDIDEVVAIGVPVYAAAVAPRGTLKNHEGWTGIPIAVGGVSVSPGDYVAGDSDGVVVVPAGDGAAVCERARAGREAEEARDARILNGESLASVLGLPPAG